MDTLKTSLFAVILMALLFTSCKKDEEVTLTAEDLTYNYVGCPENANQRAMGKVNATTTQGTLTYSIVSQSFNTVLVINASTGEISVKNDNTSIDQLLDAYYDNPSGSDIRKLTLVVAVSNGSETKNVNVTINLTFNCA